MELNPSLILNEIINVLGQDSYIICSDDPYRTYTATFLAFASGFLISKGALGAFRQELVRFANKFNIPHLYLSVVCDASSNIGKTICRFFKALSAWHIRPDREGDLHSVVRHLRDDVSEGVDAVFVGDCLSAIEMVALAVQFRLKGLHSMFLRTFFVNLRGVTGTVGEQLGVSRGIIRKYGETLMHSLGAKKYDLSYNPDVQVHRRCGISEFVEVVPLKQLYDQLKSLVEDYGRVLVATDHGYNFYLKESFIYVEHGTWERRLDLSSFAPFLLIWRAG